MFVKRKIELAVNMNKLPCRRYKSIFSSFDPSDYQRDLKAIDESTRIGMAILLLRSPDSPSASQLPIASIFYINNSL